MSRDIFSDELLDEERPERDVYEEPSGIPYVDSGLVRKIIHLYNPKGRLGLYVSEASGSPKEIPQALTRCYEDLTAVLDMENRAGLNAQTFLDAFVEEISESEAFLSPWYHCIMMDDIIQVLYNFGHNNFILDLTRVPGEKKTLGEALKGTDERTLNILYKLDSINQFAKGASHCDIELYGDAERVGDYASNCTMKLHGNVVVSAETENSTFYVEEGTQLHRHCGDVQRQEPLRHHDNPEERRSVMGSSRLLRADNHYFIPDGDEWKEVYPSG